MQELDNWIKSSERLPELEKPVLFVFTGESGKSEKGQLCLGQLEDHGRRGLYFAVKFYHKGSEIRKLYPTEMVEVWQEAPKIPASEKGAKHNAAK